MIQFTTGYPNQKQEIYSAFKIRVSLNKIDKLNAILLDIAESSLKEQDKLKLLIKLQDIIYNKILIFKNK